MHRVMIIGGPGSGKTWLADQLARRLDLPVVAIDGFIHDASGKVRPPDLIDADGRSAADGPRWIIEGGNTRTYAYRAARADCIVRLTPPRWKRLWRVVQREGWNWRLLAWTWRYDPVFSPRDRAAIAAAPGRVRIVELSSQSEIDAFLASNAHPARPLRP